MGVGQQQWMSPDEAQEAVSAELCCGLRPGAGISAAGANRSTVCWEE